MFRPVHLNRFASMAILPLMALAILWVTRNTGGASLGALKGEGVLAVASLQEERLDLYDLGARGKLTAVALSGPPHELVTAGSYVYATLDRGNALAAIDVRTRQVATTVPLSGQPHGLASDGARLYVTLDGTNELVTLDRASLVEVERRSTGSTPHAVDASGGTIFLVAAGDRQVTAIGPDGVVSATTGALPESVTVAGDYVVTADAEARQLSVFSRGSLQRIATIEVPGRPVRVVTLDGRHVVASLGSSESTVVVDLHEQAVVRLTKVGGLPDGLCFSPSRKYIAIVSNAERRVRVYRLDGWKLEATLSTAKGPGACGWLAPV
jgi:YVTN family beta-propeller protein